MIFSYQSIAPQISRPIVPIVLRSGKKFVVYWGLVDSGSDYCVFDQELVEILGVKLLANKGVKIKDVSGRSLKGKFGTITLKVCSKSYNIKAVFAKIGKFNHGILGNRGFFDRFDVKLSYKKQVIDIQPISRSS